MGFSALAGAGKALSRIPTRYKGGRGEGKKEMVGIMALEAKKDSGVFKGAHWAMTPFSVT